MAMAHSWQRDPAITDRKVTPEPYFLRTKFQGRCTMVRPRRYSKAEQDISDLDLYFRWSQFNISDAMSLSHNSSLYALQRIMQLRRWNFNSTSYQGMAMLLRFQFIIRKLISSPFQIMNSDVANSGNELMRIGKAHR